MAYDSKFKQNEVDVFNRRKPIKEYSLFYEEKKLAVNVELKYRGLIIFDVP